MRIRPRPVASPPGRTRGVFAGPAIGLPVSGGSMQTLRGGNRKRRFRAIGGKSGGKTESTSRKSRGNEMANSASIWDYGFRNGRNEAFRYERHVLITRRSSVRIRPPRPKHLNDLRKRRSFSLNHRSTTVSTTILPPSFFAGSGFLARKRVLVTPYSNLLKRGYGRAQPMIAL